MVFPVYPVFGNAHIVVRRGKIPDLVQLQRLIERADSGLLFLRRITQHCGNFRIRIAAFPKRNGRHPEYAVEDYYFVLRIVAKQGKILAAVVCVVR